MNRNSKILIIGHNSLVGGALAARLKADGYKKILKIPTGDLMRQGAVERFFKDRRPEYVFFVDVRSGGIIANSTHPAEFIYDNLEAQINVIHAAFKAKVKKLLFVASSCSYPKMCRQPMKEEYLLGGLLEPTSEAYSVAKIAGIKMCQAYNKQYGTKFISVIPATPYGRHDDFDAKDSHVIPALIRKFNRAKVKGDPSVSIWGTGRPLREFIHADDLADALIFLMRVRRLPELINIGTGKEISIRDLAVYMKEITGFRGRLKFDISKPDGAYRKSLDTDRLKTLGWKARIGLRDGLRNICRDLSTSR
ncbi:MAG: GDP-L-fucose synthase [Candidatus Omnitrophica bacterium]|nr:GDP-L-fucose synthase [Candidatus Omnitrophota bacterium]MBU1808346.1 GDP-L-fucose synthase [Candidatus Omnitrophota bacterium]